MVQGINNQHLLSALKAQKFGQTGVNYHTTQTAKDDSFNGKTILTLATIAGAIIFRKKIGNFVSKHCPKVAEFFSKHVSTPIKNFTIKHKDNFFVKGLRWAKVKFLKAENWVKGFFKKAPAKAGKEITENAPTEKIAKAAEKASLDKTAPTTHAAYSATDKPKMPTHPTYSVKNQLPDINHTVQGDLAGTIKLGNDYYRYVPR